MKVEYSPNFSGFFDIYLQSKEFDAEIDFDIPSGQLTASGKEAVEGWNFELSMGDWGAIEPDYLEYTDVDFPQWFAEQHSLSDGRYSFSWRIAYETILGYGEIPTDYNSWIEISDIQLTQL